ncbi:MAG: M23 family metallopeptidase [bacterium]
MKEKKKYIQRLKNKYRLSIYNDKTFEEVWFIRLSRLNVISMITGITLVAFIAMFSLIAYTGVREFIPGYPDGQMRTAIVRTALLVDSLENEIRVRDQYFTNLNNIIRGELLAEEEPENDNATVDVSDISFKRSPADSMLRKQIEEEEKYNLLFFEDKKTSGEFAKLHFFSPLRGIVTNPFNPDKNHFGTDIVAAPNEIVKVVLDGTVMIADWTLETGYVITVQHENNLISVYKHNSELLKKVGNKVEAGEAIAIVGNSGELTTGPHLHFELWLDGRPLNPEDYIVF